MELSNKNILEAIEKVAINNHLSKTEVEEILKHAFIRSFNKLDPDAELTFIIDYDKNIFKFINKTKIVIDEKTEYPQIEIYIKDAKKINPNVSVGDEIEDEIDIQSYSRAMSQQLTQLFTQGIREAKKQVVFAKYKELVGEMIDVTVKSIGKNHAVFKLDDGTEAFMPPQNRNMKNKLTLNSRVKVYVEEVLEESKSAQIIVSNGSTQMIKRVLEIQVPEIADGTVEVVGISRVAGVRSKVAVRTSDPNVDPIGSIIGESGSRILQITKKLDGEKIDIIKYSNDLNEFIINAIAPAKVASVVEKEDGNKIVITPNRHQTLAIGRSGVNVRLTVELTKTRIDVMSLDEAKEQGLKFELNGNVNETQIALIESGEKIQNNRGASRRQGFNGSIMSDFDDEIESFESEISEIDKFEPVNPSEFKIKEDELIEIQDDFAFDQDFSEADIDDDFSF